MGSAWIFFYSSTSKTRSPVPCSHPSRLTAPSLLLTSSMEAVNKYMKSTTLYHPLIALVSRSFSKKRALWETRCRRTRSGGAPNRYYIFDQIVSQISEEATHHFYSSAVQFWKTIRTTKTIVIELYYNEGQILFKKHSSPAAVSI